MRDYDTAVDAEFYDDFCAQFTDDLPFYIEEAQKARTPILDIGCGTGRVLIPLAETGVQVVGLDRSSAMLEIARRKLSNLAPEIQKNITLIEEDVREFALEQRFDLIIIPFCSFMLLHTREDQKKALRQIQNHLLDGGRLIFHVNSITDHTKSLSTHKFTEFTRSSTGRRVITWVSQEWDPSSQIQKITCVFDELEDKRQTVLQRTYSSLTTRWTYRFEMENLLELCGFEMEALYGGFRRESFQYDDKNQIWVTKK